MEAAAGVGGAPLEEQVLEGLAGSPKRLPTELLYDALGSRLFAAICTTPEYYLTRCERQILQERAGEIASLAGCGRTIIEPGGGDCEKVELLLGHLRPRLYLPIDISAETLAAAAIRLKARFPKLQVSPCIGDFRGFQLPATTPMPRLIFFPGSTLGNFEPEEVVGFLGRLAAMAGPEGAMVIGVDLRKARPLLEAAYNDRSGWTAAFNLNLLARINREMGGDFLLDRFTHRAIFDEERSRVEMHLVSCCEQRVRVLGRRFAFRCGETIHTENSYKYSLEGFRGVALQAGWVSCGTWTDRHGLFSVHYLRVG